MEVAQVQSVPGAQPVANLRAGCGRVGVGVDASAGSWQDEIGEGGRGFRWVSVSWGEQALLLLLRPPLPQSRARGRRHLPRRTA